MSSRWAEDEAAMGARKREKEEKKQRKQKRLEEEAALKRKRDEEAAAAVLLNEELGDGTRAGKRQRTEEAGEDASDHPDQSQLHRSWGPCRSVDEFETLNHIEEGSYGWVSRARSKSTSKVVALKKLKMDSLNEGFPVTALREIQTLKACRHNHIVALEEVVVGDALKDVYIVMEFLEHDLKTLQEDMETPFLPSEIKTLMLQITDAVAYLHENWILHRDLKTSNILMNNRGEVKLADFGMARYYGDPPPKHMTQLVVTLWYRAPELLLGAQKYGDAIDIWSLGCVFGELLQNSPLLPGRNEMDQLGRIFGLCGVPDEKSWPRFRSLPSARSLKFPRSDPKTKPQRKMTTLFPQQTPLAVNLLADLLTLDPNQRPDAKEVLEHPWFLEDPRPKAKEMFPTFPSKAGRERRRRMQTPRAPRGGEAPRLEGDLGVG